VRLGCQDMSLEKPALNDLIPMVGRPTSGRGGGGAMGRSSRLGDSQLASTGGGGAAAAGGVSAGQARMAAVRELQEENARLREKLADIQVRAHTPRRPGTAKRASGSAAGGGRDLFAASCCPP
jgi:hypothetical protein